MDMERIKTMKHQLMSAIEGQLCDINNADAKELGEVVDMLKDLSEYCYYCSITEAMEKNSDEENQIHMDKYLPESRYYDRLSAMRPRYIGKRMYNDNLMYDDKMIYDDEVMRNGMMYYTGGNSMGRNGRSSGGTSNNYYNNYDRNIRDVREGRSGLTRRTYMESMPNMSKEKRMQEMDKYMHDLADDIVEMIEGMDENDKVMIRGKINELANKIV